MKEEYSRSVKRAEVQYKQNKKFFEKLKKLKPKEIDGLFHEHHDEVFACIDCLQCANCCKTTGPRLTDKDIERVSQHLKIRPAVFVDTYLRIDEDKDYVFKTMPCPFLDSDNYCKIYEARPKACREYPHTDRQQMHQILGLTLKNSVICPAVANIVEQIKESTKY